MAPPVRERRPPVGTAARRAAGGSLSSAFTGRRHGAHSAANGVCHSNVRITPNAGIPAEKEPPRNWGSFPPPAFGGLCRPPPGELARGRRSLACASLRLVAWAPCAMFSVRVAPSATRRALPRLRNPDERCLPFQCTDHAERWDSRREGTTSELGVLPAARLRRAVPAPTGRTGQRSAFPCLRVAPPGGMSARRHVQRSRGAFCDSASAPRLRNPDERCLPFQCTDHAERWDSRREGTTSELGVLPAARLRRAVPAPTGRTGQRSAFPCLRVAPAGGLGAVRHVQRPRGAFCDSASAPEVEESGRTVSAIPMYGSRRRRDSRREGTTSELGVLPAARLRRAVPTRGRRSLACASLRPVAWAPCAMFSVRVAPSATRRALPRLRNPDERCLPFQCTDHADAGIPAEKEPPRNWGSFPPPAYGGLCRPEVGVPLPARRSAWWLGRHAPVQRPRGAFCDSASASSNQKMSRRRRNDFSRHLPARDRCPEGAPASRSRPNDGIR